MKVLIVNGCGHVCSSLKGIISCHPIVQVTGAVTSSDAAIKSIEKEVPEILIMDVVISGLDGYDFIRVIRSRFPGTRILVATRYLHPFTVRYMIKHGAKGLISLDADKMNFLNALDAVYSGDYINDIASEQLFRDIRTRRLKVPFLRGRQKEILRLISKGFANYAIGVQLGISPITVKANCLRIYEKIELPDGCYPRRYLIAFTIQTGIASID